MKRGRVAAAFAVAVGIGIGGGLLTRLAPAQTSVSVAVADQSGGTSNPDKGAVPPLVVASASPAPAIYAQPGVPPDLKDVTSLATVTAAGSRGETVQATAGGGWKADSSGTGWTLSITFQKPTTVRAVGIDPGDDRPDPVTGADLWTAHWSVSEASVIFDSGPTYDVKFGTDSNLPLGGRLQYAYVAPETTTHITIRMTGVVAPTAATLVNDTLVSQVSVLGE